MARRPEQYRPRKPAAKQGGPRRGARDRGYTHQWERRRKAWLREQWEAITDPEVLAYLPSCLPPCVDCLSEGRVVEATEVDHEIPHRGDPTLFWAESNWTPRCKSHHSAKTQRGG